MQFDKTGTGSAAAGDLAHRYLWGAAVDQLLADEVVDDGGAEDVVWTLGDHLNTTRDLAVYDAVLGETTIDNHRTFGEKKGISPIIGKTKVTQAVVAAIIGSNNWTYPLFSPTGRSCYGRD